MSVSSYVCDVYDPLTLYEKNSIFFNMDHILHRLYDLINVIWVILSKKKNITPVVSKNQCNIFLFILFWSSHWSFARNLTLSRLQRQMCVMCRRCQHIGILPLNQTQLDTNIISCYTWKTLQKWLLLNQSERRQELQRALQRLII